jgi:hypothetical protein
MDLRSLWRRFGGSTAADSGSSSNSGSDAADSSDSADGGQAGAERRVAAERPSRPAWRDLAPIRRTIQAHPLVAPTVSFSHALPGHQPAPLALETLGHDRPADAPAGVVTGLFVGHSPHTPVQDETGGTARASVRGRAPRSTKPAVEPGPPRLAGSPASAPTGPIPRPSPASVVSSVSIAPTHRPVVARSVAGSSAAAAMTSAPPTTHAAPAGSIGRPAVAGSTPALPRPVAAASLAPAASVSPSISITATPIEPDAAGLGAVARRNLGQTRRLRIGPAIGPGTLEPGDGGRPDGHRSDRTNASGPGASQPDPIRDLTVAGGPPSSPPGRPGSGATRETPGPSLTAARSAAGHEPPDESDTAQHDPPDVLRSAAEPGTHMRPVPARPIAPPRRVERAPLVGRLEVTHGGRSAPATDIPGARTTTTAPRADAPTPRSTVQEALAALSSASTNVPAAATVTGGGSGAGWAGPSIQRSASETPWTDSSSGSAGSAGFAGSADRGDASIPRPGGATNAASPIVARSVGGWTGPATASRGTASGSWSPPVRQLRATGAAVADGSRPAGGHGVVGTVASRSFASSAAAAPSEPPDGTLRRSADTADDDGQTGPDTGEEVGSSDVLQRLETGAIAAATGPMTTVTAPTVQRADGGEGGAAGAAGAAGSDKELDELARKLFPRLQLRLRGELLIDRERIGALVDLGR